MIQPGVKRRIEELETLLARYERTAAFLPVYLYAARIENGRIIPEFYSPVVERITGYGREEFMRDPWFWLTLVHEEDRPRIDEALKDEFRQEHEISEYRIVCKDGSLRWVRDQLRVSFGEDGRPTGYYGTVEDITEQKQIEAELAASEQRYRDLVETADDVIFQQDLDSLITSINTAGERFFCRPRAEILGRQWLELAAQLSLQFEPAPEDLCSQIAEAGVARVTARFPGSEGKIFDFKLTLMCEGGSVVGLCGVGRDITLIERQRAQLADAYLRLKSAQEQLVGSERTIAMAQLAGTLMHEINNPLSVILGYAQMLGQASNLPEQVVLQLQKIAEMSLRISDIVSQLDSLEDSIVEFGGAKIIDLHRQQNKSESGDKQQQHEV